MENLPPEIIISVLEKCDMDDLGSIQLYCESWQSVLDDDSLFLQIFQKENEEAIWQKVFPTYPQLTGVFSKNFILYQKILCYRYVAQCANFVCEGAFQQEIARYICKGENPPLNIADFERYLYHMSHCPQVDIVKFLTYMIELHNWPFCFQGYRTQFTGPHGIYWKTICDMLTRSNFANVLNFLEKFKAHIIWNTRELYKYLNEEFLLRNKSIWGRLDWSSIFVKVQLSESLLENILEVSAQRESWYGKWPNISYITSHQQMSEAFIEHWFVNTCFDNRTNWSNILRCQNISTHFKDKYEYKSKRRN